MIRIPRLLVAAFAFAAIAGPAGAQQKMDTATVAQAFQSLLYLPLYVAIDKGYFKKHGVDVTKTTAGSGANGVASVIQGSSTFSLQDPMTAVLANLKGAKLKAVGAVVNGAPVWIIVKKESPIKALGDLQGKTIATAIAPSTSTYMLRNLMAQKNIKPVEQNVLLGTEIAPLLAGKVDAAAVYEPYLEEAIAQGCRILYEFSTRAPGGYAFSSIDTLEATAKTKPALVQAFIDGLDEAIHFMNADPAGAADVAVAEFPSISADIVRSGVKRMFRERVYPRSALIEESAFTNALALQIQVGNIKPNAVAYGDLVDPAFAQKTAKR
ncbi:MAG: ABC transporter substrate-binding protein [Vulcanimicrobiaceae bacterium]